MKTSFNIRVLTIFGILIAFVGILTVFIHRDRAPKCSSDEVNQLARAAFAKQFIPLPDIGDDPNLTGKVYLSIADDLLLKDVGTERDGSCFGTLALTEKGKQPSLFLGNELTSIFTHDLHVRYRIQYLDNGRLYVNIF
jgi:hypothetical protein